MKASIDYLICQDPYIENSQSVSLIRKLYEMFLSNYDILNFNNYN